MNKKKNRVTNKLDYKGLPAKKSVSKKTGPLQSIKKKSSFYAVCIGASAGGLNAVSELVSQLPAGINAAILIVLHLSKASMGDILVSRIKKNSSIPCQLATDKDILQPGHVYISPPDVHLLVKQNNIVIGHGPAENRFRPSIDVLFRSAATQFGEKAIGVILTGLLNDGTAGMWAIKQCGGHSIVQDPNEAEYPDMPLSVMENMEVDHCISLKKMGATITDILKESKVKNIIPPPVIVAESRLSEKNATGIHAVSNIGLKTIYACPDCGGGLWKIEDGRSGHYRCHIGHSYSESDLAIKQSEAIEQTLWIAVRMMEERKLLLSKIARESSDKGLGRLNAIYIEQAEDLDIHIEKMKELLFIISRE